MRQARAHRARPRGGYTMVEVMMGLGILAVGAAGIISLQKFTIQGTMNSRAAISGSNVASTWVERLRTEASDWNDPNNGDAAGLPAPLGPLFASMPPNAVGPWIAPAGNAQTMFGETATAAPDDAAFCTHLRGTWLGPDDSSDIIRVEVRTFWAKSGRSVDAECALAATTWDNVFDDPTVGVGVGGITRTRAEYGIIYLTAIVRRNTQ